MFEHNVYDYLAELFEVKAKSNMFVGRRTISLIKDNIRLCRSDVNDTDKIQTKHTKAINYYTNRCNTPHNS